MFSVAMLAGAFAVAGCAQAATKIGSTASAATTSTAAGGQAHIVIYSVNSDGPYLRAIVSGVIGDYGPAETVDQDGAVDPSHGSDLEIKLTRGSFRLSIKAVDQKFVQATSSEPIYPAPAAVASTLATSLAISLLSGGVGFRTYVQRSAYIVLTDRQLIFFESTQSTGAVGKHLASFRRPAVTSSEPKRSVLFLKVSLVIEGMNRPLKLTFAPLPSSVRRQGRLLADALPRTDRSTWGATR